MRSCCSASDISAALPRACATFCRFSRGLKVWPPFALPLFQLAAQTTCSGLFCAEWLS
jgi:hypothetical protein